MIASLLTVLTVLARPGLAQAPRTDAFFDSGGVKIRSVDAGRRTTPRATAFR
jgi:hypothetical protein